MPFGWSDFIELAEWLHVNADKPQLPTETEAAQRSSTSRAYYGAFHLAMALLVKKGEYTPEHAGIDHENVIRSFRNHNGTPRQRIGLLLGRLRGRRTKADYAVPIDKPWDLAEASLRDAKEIRGALQYQ